MEKISREKFVRLAGTLGVGVAAASAAACGGSSGNGGSGNSGGGDSGGDNSGGEESVAKKPEQDSGAGGSAIAAESDVMPGSAMKFKDSGEDAVLVHLENGDFVAYSAVCTHQGCVVAYKEGQLACPCHGSVFDAANGGEVVTGPAETPLPGIPVEVQDGNVVKA